MIKLGLITAVIFSSLFSYANALERNHYVFSDGFGNSSKIVSENGLVLSSAKYEPYGEKKENVSLDKVEELNYKYGQTYSSIVNMGRRFYAPEIKQFLSPDPVGPIDAGYRHIGQYHYANGNPILYTDPQGDIAFVPVIIWGVALYGSYTAGNEVGTVGYQLYTGEMGAKDLVGVAGVSLATTVALKATPVGNIASTVLKAGLRKMPEVTIKPGTANGPTAGQAFPKSVKDAAKAENPTATCVYCLREGTGTQVDHSIPRARNGDATIDNAQLACPHCNASKGARDFPKTPPSDYVGPWPPDHW